MLTQTKPRPTGFHLIIVRGGRFRPIEYKYIEAFGGYPRGSLGRTGAFSVL